MYYLEITNQEVTLKHHGGTCLGFTEVFGIKMIVSNRIKIIVSLIYLARFLGAVTVLNNCLLLFHGHHIFVLVDLTGHGASAGHCPQHASRPHILKVLSQRQQLAEPNRRKSHLLKTTEITLAITHFFDFNKFDYILCLNGTVICGRYNTSLGLYVI